MSFQIAPGSKGHWLLGSAAEFSRDPLHFLLELFRAHGDVARFYIGPRPLHLLSHPDAIRHVFQDRATNYRRLTQGYKALRLSLGDGLLTTEGAIWLRQRRLMQPIFHRQFLSTFVPIITERVARLIEDWRQPAATGEPVNVSRAFMKLTLDILGRSLFGTGLEEHTAVMEEALLVGLRYTVDRARSIWPAWILNRTPAYRRFMAEVQRIDDLVYGLIDHRRRNPSENRDLLSILLAARDAETGRQMDDRSLRDELYTMLTAGHETTAMSLSWTYVLLSRNPEAQRRLAAEVQMAVGDRSPEFPDLARLPYCAQVFNESLRLFPPAWSIARLAVAEDEILGFRIPAQTAVFTSPYVTHRHPAFWKDPETFDPERFAPEKPGSQEDPSTSRPGYFPFGAGGHLCIGKEFAILEARLTLAAIAQHYHLELVPGHVVQPEPLVTLRPRDGVLMRIRSR